MGEASQPEALHARIRPRHRILYLLIGSAIALIPVVGWATGQAMGIDALIERRAQAYAHGPDEIYLAMLLAAGIAEMLALFFLQKTDQKPRDWIAVLGVVSAGVAIVLMVFFGFYGTGVIFHGS